jgi:hypothetical protein
MKQPEGKQPMKRQQIRGWRAWLALACSLTLVAAACADDEAAMAAVMVVARR